MTRHDKKQQFDSSDDGRSYRFQRRHRGHKTSAVGGVNKQERRHGWGYVKRRALLAD